MASNTTPQPPPNFYDTIPDATSLKTRSYELTGDPSDSSHIKRLGTRSFMYIAGASDSDMKKPVILIAAPYAGDAASCNQHFLKLTEEIKEEVVKLGGLPYVTHPPVISDGVTMGAEGMRYSLPSRDLVANSIELMAEGYRVDAMVTVGGCDKTQPGCVMPMARHLDLFGVTVYGGGRHPGTTGGQCPKWEAKFGSEVSKAHRIAK